MVCSDPYTQQRFGKYSVDCSINGALLIPHKLPTTDRKVMPGNRYMVRMYNVVVNESLVFMEMLVL